MTQGMLVIAVIAGWHLVNSYLSYRSQRFDRLVGGEPAVLVKDGALVRRSMRQERVNEEELWSLLRLQGIEELKDVKAATLEPDGLLSVLKTDEARELRKSDLDRVLRKAA